MARAAARPEAESTPRAGIDVAHGEPFLAYPETYGAIVSHFLFEYAHPFYDGNGRTGRYLLAVYLSRPLSTLTALSVSRSSAESRGAYYRAFREVEDSLNHGELTPLVLAVTYNFLRTLTAE